MHEKMQDQFHKDLQRSQLILNDFGDSEQNRFRFKWNRVKLILFQHKSFTIHFVLLEIINNKAAQIDF